MRTSPLLSGEARGSPAVLPLALLLFALWLPAAIAAPPLQAFTASYEFRHNGLLLAKMDRKLRPGENGTYILESKAAPAGILSALIRDRVVESSVWEYANNRPRPIKYQYHHTGRGEDRHVILDFNWQKGTVINSINNSPWTMKVPQAVQDKLLYQYSLMMDMATPGAPLEYPVADGGGLKDYRFERLGEESLETPLGRLKTVKLRRIGDKRNTTLWCAPAYGFLPVRIEQRKDGRVLVMIASKIKMN